MRDREKIKGDWLMLALVAPIVIIGIVVLYFGAKDVESREQQPQPTEYNIDSLRQVERNLRTLEDSVHFYEDGL